MKLKNILILAGGQSTRFWPLSHKNMLPFLGKPLIQHQLEVFRKYADNLVVVSNEETYKDIVNLAKHANAHVVIQSGEGQSAAIMSAKDHVSGETLIANTNDIYQDSVLPTIV